MTPRRVLNWGLAGGWVFLFIASYTFYSVDFRTNFRMITAPAGERALFESGDKPYYDLLSRAPAYEPGANLLVLSVDQLGQAEFLSYRACYQLYPIRPLYIPLSFIPPAGSRISMNPDPNLLNMLREKGVTIAVLFIRPDPVRSAYYRIVLDNSGKMTLVKLPLKPAPALPPSAHPLMWLAGLALTGLFGAGFLFLSGLFRGIRADAGTNASLAFYAGIGLTAWLMVTLGVFHAPFSIPLVAGGWLVVLALAGGRWFMVRRATPLVIPGDAPVPSREPAAGALSWGWSDRVGVGLAIFAACWAVLAVAVPMSAWGNWDTWAIWNLKAKACWLARGIPFPLLGDPVYRFSHHDYPLGLPMIHAWLATWAGGIDERLLRLLSPFYLFILFFLLAGLLKELGVARGKWLVAAAFITIPKAIQQGYSGYADLPVACGMAAGMLVLVRAYRGEPVGWMAGLFGGLAAVHKDEGLIWGGTSILLLAVWARRGRMKWNQVAAAAVILAVLVGPWKATTARLGLRPNDYQVQPVKMLDDAPDRIPQVLRAVVLETLGPGVSMQGIAGMESPPSQWWIQYRGAWFLLWYAILLWAVLGFRRWRSEPVLAWLVLLPAVQASAYAAVYTASVAASVPWHITTSLDRLLLQIAPSLYVLTAAACFGPALESTAPNATVIKGKPGKAKMPGGGVSSK